MYPPTFLLLMVPFWDLIIPTNPTEFWTMIAGVGTAALTVMGFIGLRSLVLTKKDMLTRAQRDARESAIERFEEMAGTILPDNARLWTAIAASKIDPILVPNPGAVRFDPENQEHVNLAKKVREKLSSEVVKDTIFFLNQLETWAAYFTKRLADHEIAFGPCAAVFCSAVWQHYAILLKCRADTTAGKVPNLVELFTSWRGQLADAELALREEDLEKQQAALMTARGKNKSTLQPPLGFDLDEG
jgi:hypothetical protein